MEKIAIAFLFVMLSGCAQQIGSPAVESELTRPENTPLDLGRYMKRLELSCSNFSKSYSYIQLVELRDRPNIPDVSYDVRLYLAFSSADWVPLVREKSCQLALLKNMEEGILYSLENLPKTSFMHNELYLASAYSKYARIALEDSLDIENDFAEADRLIKVYIDGDDGNFKPEYAMAYFFAASTLTNISRLSRNPIVKKLMLSRSIEISKSGLPKARDKSEVLLALNGAMREVALYNLNVCEASSKCSGSP